MTSFNHSSPKPSVELARFAEEFWKWRAATQPFSPDDISRVERPGGTRDWSREAIARRRSDWARFDERWRKIDCSSGPVSEQVDYRLLGSALARVRWELDVLRRWERDPNFYIEQTLTALQEALTVPGPYSTAQSAEILGRIENIPSIVEAAQQNLTQASAPFTDLTIRSLNGIGDRLRAMTSALRPQTTLSLNELAGAIEQAIRALERYREWLQRLAPSLPRETAIGRDAYAYFLSKVALMPYTPEELLDMGRQEMERAIAFEQIEANRNAGLPPLKIAPDLNAQMERSIAGRRRNPKFSPFAKYPDRT